MPQQAGIRLSLGQKKVLKKFMHGAKDKREYRAAFGILLRAERVKAKDVGEKLGVTIKQVFMWCRKFREEGVEGLRVKKQSGRPAIEGKKAKKVLVNLLNQDPQTFGFLKGKWVLRDISKALKKEGITLHYSSVHRMLGELGIVQKSPILRAQGSIKKNYSKREEIRRYKKVAAALLKKELLSPFRMKNG